VEHRPIGNIFRGGAVPFPPTVDTDVILKFEPYTPIRLKEKVNQFVTWASTFLNSQGFNIPLGIPGVHFREEYGQVQNRILLTFDTLTQVRAFVFTFCGYSWTSNSGREGVVIMLSNSIIDAEKNNSQIRLMINGNMQPADLRLIQEVGAENFRFQRLTNPVDGSAAIPATHTTLHGASSSSTS